MSIFRTPKVDIEILKIILNARTLKSIFQPPRYKWTETSVVIGDDVNVEYEFMHCVKNHAIYRGVGMYFAMREQRRFRRAFNGGRVWS